MLRRKPDATAPDPLTQTRLALEATLKREARVTTLAWSGFQIAARMDEALKEAHAGAPPELRPLLGALLDLRLGTLCGLPLRLLGGEDVQADFRAVFGYPPNVFQDPVQAAAQLLDLRTHTVTTYLLRLAAGGPISVDAIREQGRLDLAVIIEQEREARKQAAGSP